MDSQHEVGLRLISFGGASPVELIQHIFEGKKLQAIALDMGLALGTVKTYSQRIYRKLRVSDQRELTVAVLSIHLKFVTVSGKVRITRKSPMSAPSSGPGRGGQSGGIVGWTSQLF